jgi:hypothetical protein
MFLLELPFFGHLASCSGGIFKYIVELHIRYFLIVLAMHDQMQSLNRTKCLCFNIHILERLMQSSKHVKHITHQTLEKKEKNSPHVAIGRQQNLGYYRENDQPK